MYLLMSCLTTFFDKSLARGKRDLLQRQKRPTKVAKETCPCASTASARASLEAKETYYRGKRDLLKWQKRPGDRRCICSCRASWSSSFALGWSQGCFWCFSLGRRSRVFPVCVHICIYIHTCVCTYINTYIRTHTYTHADTSVSSMCVYIYTCIHTHKNTHTHTYTHTDTSVSSMLPDVGDTVAIIQVLVLPPSDSCSSRVSFDSR